MAAVFASVFRKKPHKREGTASLRSLPLLCVGGKVTIGCMSAVNGDELLLLHFGLSLLLRNTDLQDTVFKLRLDILFGYILAYKEASAAGTVITLSADVLAFLVLLVLLLLFGSMNYEISNYELYHARLLIQQRSLGYYFYL